MASYLQNCDLSWNCGNGGNFTPLNFSRGGGLIFNDLHHMRKEKHTYWFSATYFHDCEINWHCRNGGYFIPWEEGVDFPRSTFFWETNTNFQLSSSKTGGLIFLNVLHIRNTHNNWNFSQTRVISPPWTLTSDEELIFLDPLHMRNTHSDFQLPTSKTDLTYNHSQMGAILPPGALPSGELGGR